jgi:hypothetical protein
VAAAGPTSVSVEATMPNSPADQIEWKKNHYTLGKYVDAWRSVLQTYVADFPNQYISLSQGGPAIVDINADGQIVDGKSLDTRQLVVDSALKILGHRFVLQNSNLDGNPKGDDHNTKFVIGYVGRAVTGFQLRTSASAKGMGDDTDPVQALTNAINNGLRTNESGNHVNYIEVYAKDVLTSDMQTELSHAASLFRSTAAADPPVRPPVPPVSKPPHASCGTRCQ